MSTLMVIIPDAVSQIIAKGEYQPRYYNPGNLFDEVHILMTNSDQVDPRDVQATVGKARLSVHNIAIEESDYIRRSFFFKPWLLQKWASPILSFARKTMIRHLERIAKPAVELAWQIKPDLIRCHANDFNAVVARCIKSELGTPYLISLHTNPDVDSRRRIIGENLPWFEYLYNVFFDDLEIYGLQEADVVLPVYKSIIPYLERVGCKRYWVAYNVLSEFLTKKSDYTLHRPVRIISVGRHFELKNPENLILAVKDIPEVHLTLVGDGPYQTRLEALAQETGLTSRVSFFPAAPNIELCRMLPDYDIFAVHSQAFGIPKTVLEALLTGMPVILNRREGQGGNPPELLQGNFVRFVNNTVEGYKQAILDLMANHAERERLGRAAYATAQEKWAPEKTEAKYVEIYQRVMAKYAKRN